MPRAGVHAAAGGVGSLAVQIARELGAGVVVGAASSDSKRELVAELGADLVVDPGRSGWTEEVRKAVGEIDVVLDAVGGQVSADSLELLRPVTGRLVAYGAASGVPQPVDAFKLVFSNTTIKGYSMYGYLENRTKMDRTTAELARMHATGVLRPVVRLRLPLVEAEQAHELIRSRSSVGKVVLLP